MHACEKERGSLSCGDKIQNACCSRYAELPKYRLTPKETLLEQDQNYKVFSLEMVDGLKTM